MCGIIYAKNLKDNSPVNNSVKLLYLNQKERGYDGFGIVGMSKDELLYYRAETEKDIMKTLDGSPFDEILYHHRYPTSTTNTTKTAHPFKITYGDKIYYFVHNGIIFNAKELKAEHDTLNLVYSSYDKKIGTFNDSEALAYNFILTLNKQKTSKARGSASIICLQLDKETNRAEKLYFYTNGQSPLKIFRDKSLFVLSSETGNKDVKKDILYCYDYTSKEIKKLPIKYNVKPILYTTSVFNNDWTNYDIYDDTPVLTDKRYSSHPSDSENAELWDKRDILESELNKIDKKYQEATLRNDKKMIAFYEADLFDRESELDELDNLLYS